MKALAFVLRCAAATCFGFAVGVVGAAVVEARPPLPDPCEPGVGPWLLVYRYTVNVQPSSVGEPFYETRETFDWRRFPSVEAAYCGAERLRRTGVVLPTLDRFGRDSNVMPESITPMLEVFAVEQGIRGTR